MPRLSLSQHRADSVSHGLGLLGQPDTGSRPFRSPQPELAFSPDPRVLGGCLFHSLHRPVSLTLTHLKPHGPTANGCIQPSVGTTHCSCALNAKSGARAPGSGWAQALSGCGRHWPAQLRKVAV